MTLQSTTHLTEGDLRAHLDGELIDAELREHLAHCSACQAQLEALEGRSVRITESLSVLAPSADDPALAARPAFARFTSYARARTEKEKIPMWTKLFTRFRPALVGLSVVAALAVALSFPGVRAWAGQFLGLFRVQQITVLPIDTTRLSDLSGDEALGRQISQLFSDSVKVTKEPAKPQTVADAAEASRAANFTVRLPEGRTDTPQLTLQDGTAFEFSVNRERAQAMLTEAGVTDVQLPASLDNAPIRVNVPTAVTAAYGNCPSLNEDESASGSRGRRYANCVMLVQIPSPTVTTPPDLDIAKLAEIGLQFTGMTAAEAHAYSQNVDWASTLVIPIPRNGASYRQVPVDGVTGTLIERPVDDAPQYALVWVKNGIVYAISGLGSDSASALAMANSLK